MKIKYENLKAVNEPLFKDYKKTFNEILNSGWYILGKKLHLFEKQFANYINTKYCLGVASGLDALVIALKSLNLKKDSEIIVPSNTYIATILSILNNDLKPILVEPDLKTYNIDPNKIEKNITNKTKAILVVHLYGKPCDMDQIEYIAKKYKLKIIEDCAQAHGAKINNKTVGSFGIGCFSFYPTKNLGALGDGGAITMNDKSTYDFVKSYRNYGSEKKYYNNFIGINSRLDEMQAGFLLCKMKHMDKINSHKRKLAKLYNKYLSDKFIKPHINDSFTEVYHIYPIRFNERDKLKEYLYKNGIGTEIHYPVPPHKQNALKHLFKDKKYPIASLIHNTILSLPISYGHSKEDIMKIIKIMNSYD